MSNPVVSWAKDHPVAAGAAALGIIVVVMLATGGSGSQEDSGASGGMGAAGLQAYYAAVANQSQAGAAVQIAEVQANAETNKALIAANYGIESAKIWAPIQTLQIQTEGTNTAASIAANKEVALAVNQNNWHMYDQYINLENSKLAVQQNIAFKQINSQKKSVFSQILSAATTIIPAIATGGASLAVPGIGSVLGGGSGAATVPSMGSSGQWV